MEEENEEKMEKEKGVRKEANKNPEETIVKKLGEKFAVSILSALLAGLSIGFMAGVLFAPKEGKKIRKEIVDKSKEIYQKGEKVVNDAFDKSKGLAEESKEKFSRIKDIIAPKKVGDAKEKDSL